MESSIAIEPGVLYVVATPIGNLDDIGARALAVLRGVDRILAEDTRHSARLLQHHGIRNKLLSLHEHNERQRVPQLLDELAGGHALALISDAGTPLISDPGFPLLRELHQRGLRAVPVPGPCSPIAALSVAGLPTDRFAFEGFLPAKGGVREARLRVLADYPHTLVFLEASHRIHATLQAMVTVFGADRRATVARELTKVYEQVLSAGIGELADHFADPARCRGEFVVVVAGAEAGEDLAEARRLLAALLEELPAGRAAALVAKLTGVAKNRLYRLALELRSGAGPSP